MDMLVWGGGRARATPPITAAYFQAKLREWIVERLFSIRHATGETAKTITTATSSSPSHA